MVDWLERAAARRPGHPAIVADGATLTYAQLLERAQGAEPLETLTHAPGLDFAVRLHALLLAGGPLVVHTSGSTGEPKPVTLSAGNILHSALGTAAMLGIHADDRWLCPLPLHHVGGLMVLLRSVIYATTAVIGAHDPEATLASFVPTQLARGQDAGMPRLRAILLGGGPIAPEQRRAGVIETYGMTETTSMAALDGFPLPGVDITIADDGEILVSGPIVAGGGTHHSGRPRPHRGRPPDRHRPQVRHDRHRRGERRARRGGGACSSPTRAWRTPRSSAAPTRSGARRSSRSSSATPVPRSCARTAESGWRRSRCRSASSVSVHCHVPRPGSYCAARL